MNENVKKFYEEVAGNKALQEKLIAAGKAHEGKELTEEERTVIWERDILPIAKEAGYVFTLAEVRKYEESANSVSGQLSEDELENVSGGVSVCVVCGVDDGKLAFGFCFISGCSIPTYEH